MSSTSMKRIRRIAAGLLAVVFLPSVLEAHAIHTTLTVLTPDAGGVTLNIRAFADDFSATVARFAARRPPADSSAPAPDVLRYVRAQFAIRDGAGHMVELQSCGIRRERELYWLCFRAAIPGGLRGTMIRNRMLTEFHADQVNIVQVEERGARHTVLFTKASAPSLIATGP